MNVLVDSVPVPVVKVFVYKDDTNKGIQVNDNQVIKIPVKNMDNENSIVKVPIQVVYFHFIV